MQETFYYLLFCAQVDEDGRPVLKEDDKLLVGKDRTDDEVCIFIRDYCGMLQNSVSPWWSLVCRCTWWGMSQQSVASRGLWWVVVLGGGFLEEVGVLGGGLQEGRVLGGGLR